MKNVIQIINASAVTPYRIIKDAVITIFDGRIAGVEKQYQPVDGALVIDATRNYVAPGFIDLHVHGGGGFDFMDATEEAFLAVARTHARYGTTSMYPTTLTGEKSDLLNTVELFSKAAKNNIQGAALMGVHMEGPYFAMSQRGAQDPRYIRNPDPAEYKEIIAHADRSIKRWSAAPELNGAMAFGRYLRSQSILAAIAHTDADYEHVIEAFENGYSLATHFYSGMSGVRRRECLRYAGVIESGYLIEEMDVEIIADGIHLPPPLLQLIYKIKGADRTALITDAMRGASMPPGESILGGIRNGLNVIVEDGVAKLPDRSSFAGSVATADTLVRNMIQLAEVPLTDAVRMITSTPARIMGIDTKKGTLTVGKDADIVIFDKDIRVLTTIVAGNIVYNRLF